MLYLRDSWIYSPSSALICTKINADIICVTLPLKMRANAVLVFEKNVLANEEQSVDVVAGAVGSP